mmetsp:Transcript_2335/g.4092  ORF Transcript_2335/g.4092 Transcript_2335/m.4092 type:complete len:275 (-) Transcript_2335:758-1582(-)
MDSLFEEHFSVDDWLSVLDVTELEPIDPLRLVSYDTGDDQHLRNHLEHSEQFSGITYEAAHLSGCSLPKKSSQNPHTPIEDTDFLSRVIYGIRVDTLLECNGTCGANIQETVAHEIPSQGFLAFFEHKSPTVSHASSETGIDANRNEPCGSFNENEKIKQPSQFCHVCLRNAKNVKQVSCRQIEATGCRKVVCRKCFDQFGWDWQSAFVENSSWMCPHCRNQCPARATCNIYYRTNQREQKKKRKRRGSARNEEKPDEPTPVAKVPRALLPKLN